MSGHPRILALFGCGVLFGQERGNIEALTVLRDQGCDVLCLIRDDDWSTIIPPALDAAGLAWEKVPYIEIKERSFARLLATQSSRFMRANWRFLRTVRRFNPTHIHAFNPAFVANFAGGLAATRTPMIYRCGDVPVVHNWVWRAVWRFVNHRTSRFVAISRFIQKALVSSGADPSTISVIYNRPPTRRPAPRTPQLVKRGPDSFVVGYVGQIVEQKGPHLLVEAVRRLAPQYPHLRLVIVGRVSEWEGDVWARDLRDKALAAPELRDRVTFTGYAEDVAPLMAACDVIATPSLCEEALGSVVLEAKQASRPSIIFPSGGLPELVDNGVDGIVCSGTDTDALEAALRSYLDAPEIAHQHGIAALGSLERLDIASFAKLWHAVYVPDGRLGRAVAPSTQSGLPQNPP